MDRDAFSEDAPFAWIECTEEFVHKILSRAMLIKCIYQIWGMGKTYNEMKNDLTNCSEEIQKPFLDKTWCIRVKCMGSSKNMKESLKMIRGMAEKLPMKAKVNLSNPEAMYHIIEDYGNYGEANAPQKPVSILKSFLKNIGQVFDALYRKIAKLKI